MTLAETSNFDGIIENNRLTVWGSRTLWASETGTMQVINNVYSTDWENGAGNRCPGDSSCGGQAQKLCCGYPNSAAVYNVAGGPRSSAVCNRYENGSFVEEAWFTCEGGGSCGVNYDVTGCPDYP